MTRVCTSPPQGLCVPKESAQAILRHPAQTGNSSIASVEDSLPVEVLLWPVGLLSISLPSRPAE